jgi:CBS domain-containing protein
MTRAAIPAPPALVLVARTAEELMSPNPISLRQDATIPEALTVLTDRGFSAAPVIDEAGRPIGVLSRTDVLVHEREQVRRALPADSTLVRDIMTPTMFTVTVNTPAADAVKRMCDLKVHQLFVVDDEDSLVGVISALDIVRCLAPRT